jgi:hypothetical protein
LTQVNISVHLAFGKLFFDISLENVFGGLSFITALAKFLESYRINHHNS